MQMAQKNPAIARGNALICLCCGAHSRELVGRHDEQKLIGRVRQKDEFFRRVPSPTRRNRDSVFLVDGMPELAGIKTFGWRIVVHVRVENSSILLHLTPLLTTFPPRGQ